MRPDPKVSRMSSDLEDCMIFPSIREAPVCLHCSINNQQGHEVDVRVHIPETNQDFEVTCFVGTLQKHC